MTINSKELLDGISILADEQNMRVAVRESGKGAIICATSCFIGGILLGPVGMAFGGTAGAISAAVMAKGKFKAVSEIVKNDLTYRQRQILTDKITQVVQELEVTDFALLLPLIMGNQSVQQAVLKTLVSFLTNEMNLQIID